MIKKPLEDPQLQRHLAELAEDSREVFLLARGQLRGMLVHGTRMVNEMRRNHEYGNLETLLLGHAFLGASLATRVVKSDGRITLALTGDGPVQSVVAEANTVGDVRGYLGEAPIPVAGPVGQAEIPGIIGDGYLTLTRLLAGDSRPYSGRVAIEHGTIAENLAHYFYASEQTRTSMSLSMVFSDDGSVAGAGGLFLQLMPDADDSLSTPIEQTVLDLRSLGEYFATGGRPISLVQEHFSEFSPVHLSSEPLRFYCSCSKERFGSFLAALPDDEKSSILEEGPFPLETVCHNCNSRYAFERDEIHELFSN